ncbi:MAG: hypothetical protein H6813_03220 [Phycisphaeraceae bacterium]|nr:hypothetical protein [Phycisphaeraceae bacterium]MCB9846956.1 hypothetical protein [Phycisphaeraceae bacterium]
MSDTTSQTGDAERTNLAPILAPIITLFIGFGAGVVFSEYIPLGKAPVIQPSGHVTPGGNTGPRDARPEQTPPPPQLDADTRKALEDAAANGDEEAKKLLEEADGANAGNETHSDGG